MKTIFLVAVASQACLAAVAFSLSRSDIFPPVNLDNGTFIGLSDGVTHSFLGIPFAEPPIGDLRYRLPVMNAPYTGIHPAVNFGSSCLQQSIGLPLLSSPTTDAQNLLQSVSDSSGTSEDCLNLNVWTPANKTASAKLPVVVWIYGGGFETGKTASWNGSTVVQRSIELGTPIVYVSMNYRLSALGFLPGKKVNAAGIGNLGLQDQRLALKWIQKYITAFGGDPTKVTIWGQSAGSMSASLHLLANGGDTEGLFRGAIMQSGYPASMLGMADEWTAQAIYDTFVQNTGCSNATDSLACLRQIPIAQITSAMDMSIGISSYQSLNLTWEPRVDGTFLTDLPQALIAAGKVASVPLITGDADDEGTAFSTQSVNITTDDQFRDYITQYFLYNVSNADIDRVLQQLYPADPTQGSPFGTGAANAITPQFKRIAAFLGDFIFQAPRRLFVQERSGKQDVWSFLDKRLKDLPVYGSAHGTDLVFAYGPADLTDYFVNFVNNLDPNGPSVLEWPKYNTSTTQAMTLQDGSTPLALEPDTYREEAIAFLAQLRSHN